MSNNIDAILISIKNHCFDRPYSDKWRSSYNLTLGLAPICCSELFRIIGPFLFWHIYFDCTFFFINTMHDNPLGCINRRIEWRHMYDDIQETNKRSIHSIRSELTEPCTLLLWMLFQNFFRVFECVKSEWDQCLIKSRNVRHTAL